MKAFARYDYIVNITSSAAYTILSTLRHLSDFSAIRLEQYWQCYDYLNGCLYADGFQTFQVSEEPAMRSRHVPARESRDRLHV